MVRGHQAYYAVPGNNRAVNAFRTQAARHWLRAAAQEPEVPALPWTRMNRIATRWLPPTRTLHPFPEVRFAANPRQEPSAVVPHAGICAGGRPQDIPGT